MKVYILCGGSPRYGLDSPPEAFSTKAAACDYLLERSLEHFSDCPFKNEKDILEWKNDAIRFTDEVKHVKNHEVAFPYVFDDYENTLFELEVDDGLKEMGLK